MYLQNNLRECDVVNILKRTWGLSAVSVERHIAKVGIYITQPNSQNGIYFWDYYSGITSAFGGSIITTTGGPLFYGMVSWRYFNDTGNALVGGVRLTVKNWFIRTVQVATQTVFLNLDIVKQYAVAPFTGDPFPGLNVTDNQPYEKTGLNILNTGMNIEVQTDATGLSYGAILLDFQGWKINLS